jgi:acetyl esterase/lipase
MTKKTINLGNEHLPNSALDHGIEPLVLDLYLTDSKGGNSACMVICPGGGYAARSCHEGEPVAQWINRLGISAAVLHYRVAPYRHPVPIADAQRALRYLRRNASHLIDPNRIGILGFSAGGHLSAAASTLFDHDFSNGNDPDHRLSARPNLAVLCYPLISMATSYTHQGAMENLLGCDPNQESKMLMSLENQISKNTPPTFLWHTADDEVCPVENCYLMAASLSKHSTPHEMHIFESGLHGLGLNYDNSWPLLCSDFLKRHGFLVD